MTRLEYLEYLDSLPPLPEFYYGPCAVVPPVTPAVRLREVGRDIAAFAPDLHREFADAANDCQTDAEREAVAARYERELQRELRRLSQAEGRE